MFVRTLYKKLQQFFLEKNPSFFLNCIILLGVGLRAIRGFYVADLDQDEAVTFGVAFQNSFTNLLLRNNYQDHEHPPLFFILHKVWLLIVNSEYTLRLPSFVFSIISIFLVVNMSKSLFSKDRALLILVPFYFCTSSFFVLYGILFRTYSMAICINLSLLFLFQKIYRANANSTKTAPWHYLVFTLVVTASLITDYSAIWVVGSLIIFMLLVKKIKSRLFLMLSAGVFLSLPWFLSIFYKNFNVALLSKKDTLPSFNSTIDFLNATTHFYDLKYLLLINQYISYLLGLALAIALAGIYLYRKKNPRLSLFLIISITFPYITAALFSYFISPIFDPKNLWFSNGLLIVCILMFINQLSLNFLKQIGIVTFVIIQLLTVDMAALNNSNGFYFYQTASFKKIFEYIKTAEKNQPATLLVFDADWRAVPHVYKDWHYATTPILIREIKMNDDTKISFNRSDVVYFFDIDKINDWPALEKLQSRLNCKLVDVETTVSNVFFKKCMP